MLPLMSVCKRGMHRIPPQSSFQASQITHFQTNQGQKVFFTWVCLDVRQVSRPLGINDDMLNVFLVSQQSKLLKTEILTHSSKQKCLAYIAFLSMYFSLHYSFYHLSWSLSLPFANTSFTLHHIGSCPPSHLSFLHLLYIDSKHFAKPSVKDYSKPLFHVCNLQNTKSVKKLQTLHIIVEFCSELA